MCFCTAGGNDEGGTFLCIDFEHIIYHNMRVQVSVRDSKAHREDSFLQL